SNTFDPFLDVSLEVHNAATLEKALEGFTRSEKLTGKNQYLCKKCKTKGDATKRFSLHSLPAVLTFQLKRFDFSGGFRGKLRKPVAFKPSIDVARFTSNPDQEAKYNLYGLVVHSGQSAKSGHYIAYAKHGGQWYRFNDETVNIVGEPTVLAQEAYLLFYEAAKPPEFSRATKGVADGSVTAPQTEVEARPRETVTGKGEPPSGHSQPVNGHAKLTDGH
ncbi:unnamed protein product, partial [Polarella glacialis]